MVAAKVEKTQQSDGKWLVTIGFVKDGGEIADGVEMSGVLAGERVVDTEQEADAEIARFRKYLHEVGADDLMRLVLGEVIK